MGDTEQTFLGEFEHSVDDKGRLTIPMSFREKLSGTIYVTRGLDGCLFILRPTEFAGLQAKLIAMPISQTQGRTFSRMFAAAAECELDKQGRILLPAPLREHAGLNGSVVVVGVLNRVEVWAKERWQAETARMERDSAYIAEQLTALGI